MPATQILIGQQLSQYLQCMFESESGNAIKSCEFFIEKKNKKNCTLRAVRQARCWNWLGNVWSPLWFGVQKIASNKLNKKALRSAATSDEPIANWSDHHNCECKRKWCSTTQSPKSHDSTNQIMRNQTNYTRNRDELTNEIFVQWWPSKPMTMSRQIRWTPVGIKKYIKMKIVTFATLKKTLKNQLSFLPSECELVYFEL